MQHDLVSGISTHWGWTGTGSRKIACIHCALGHSGMWRGFLNAEQTNVGALVFDLPGHGQSSNTPSDQSFPEAAFQTSLALIAAQCANPIDLIGHSFGAAIALEITRSNPQLVRSLTLIEPVLFALTRGSQVFDDLEHFMHGEFADAMRLEDYHNAARIFHGLWGMDLPWDALPQNAKHNMISRMPLIGESDAVTFHDYFRHANTGVLETVMTPTLLIEGANSPAIMSSVQDQLEMRLPNTKRRRFAGARHMLPVSHADELAREFDQFIKELPK